MLQGFRENLAQPDLLVYMVITYVGKTKIHRVLCDTVTIIRVKMESRASLDRQVQLGAKERTGDREDLVLQAKP